MTRREQEFKEQYLRKLDLIRKTEEARAGETYQEQQARIERARKDYAFCVSYYFKHYATAPTADFQVDLARDVKRDQEYTGSVRWGRGLAKSVHCDILIPFWLWLNGEPVYLVIVGENEYKAQRLLSDIQAELEANPKIKHDFGDFKGAGEWSAGVFISDKKFIGQAIGMGQDVRGLRVRELRPTIIIVDDCDNKQTVKNLRRMTDTAEWIETALYGTMDGALKRLLIVNNYFAPVTVQEILRVKHPSWKVSRVDACPGPLRKPRWHQKYPEDYYRKIESKIGTIALDAEYNNHPKIEGKIFTDEMIEWVDVERRDSFDCIIGQWDLAGPDKQTADFNAVRIMGLKNEEFYHLLTFCRQCLMSQVLDWMYEIEKTWPKTAVIHWRFESQFWNEAVRMELKAAKDRHGYWLNIAQADKPKGNKYDRILTMVPHYQARRIKYDRRQIGSNDMQTAISQLKGIEPGYSSHDDAPDAEQQAIEFLSQQIGFNDDSSLPQLGPREQRTGIY